MMASMEGDSGSRPAKVGYVPKYSTWASGRSPAVCFSKRASDDHRSRPSARSAFTRKRNRDIAKLHEPDAGSAAQPGITMPTMKLYVFYSTFSPV